MTPLFKPQTEWLPPTKFPDLRDHKEISIDLETKDPQLKTHGSGSIVGKGCVTGIAVGGITCISKKKRTLSALIWSPPQAGNLEAILPL